MIFLIILWYSIASIMVACAGGERKIGGGTALFLSLIFSPILAMLFVLSSDKLNDEYIRKLQVEKYEREIRKLKEEEIDNIDLGEEN